MSFFDKLFGNKKDKGNSVSVNVISNSVNRNSINQPVPKMPVSSGGVKLSKEESLKGVRLRKETVDKVCLGKKELNNLTARVAVVLDYSVSMRELYYNDSVQTVLERLLPIALKFDDNGQLEAWIFENGFNRLEDISIDNYYGYIENERILKNYRMGGTNYSPVMVDVLEKYTIEDPSDMPTLVIFITDGDNYDKNRAREVMKEASKYPIFWQFVGLGDRNYSFLESLDEMTGRYIDNANFFAVDNIEKMSDDELYNKILSEYPDWIREARNKNILK